jgi:hypothetical protein
MQPVERVPIEPLPDEGQAELVQPQGQQGSIASSRGYRSSRAVVVQGVLGEACRMRAYSRALRQWVRAAVAGGTQRAASATCPVRERTRARGVVPRQPGRPLVAGTRPGRRPGRAATALPGFRAHGPPHPDATFVQQRAAWQAQPPPVRPSALARSIKRAAWTRKQRRAPPARTIRQRATPVVRAAHPVLPTTSASLMRGAAPAP